MTFPFARSRQGLVALLCAVILAGLWPAAAEAASIARVQVSSRAGGRPMLAAREVRRYLYTCSGSLPTVVAADTPADAEAVIITMPGDPLLAAAPGWASPASLGREEYFIGCATNGANVWWIVGGGEQGALYGAYRFAELLGVRFTPAGDIIPDRPFAAPAPRSETGRPVFSIRGLLPFNNFPEGPDWWTREDYLGFVEQVAKMRLNFVGWHDYPTHGSWANAVAEPLVWLGLRRDLNRDGTPRVSFPSSFANSARWSWEYLNEPTSAFSNGADKFFAADVAGSELMDGLLPIPSTQEQDNELFNRMGSLFGEFVAEARGLGVKVAVGADTLYSFPDEVNARLTATGIDPASQAAMNEVYRGAIQRLWRTAPVDYYWLWSPESWEWVGLTQADALAASGNAQALVNATTEIEGRIKPAVTGWILGPPDDETFFHSRLPLDTPMGALLQSLADYPVDDHYFALDGRPKWLGHWAERDTELTALGLYAGRTLYDAAEARWAGCSGLMALHWRTKTIAPNTAALALASWDQSYVPASFSAVRNLDGASGGLTATTAAAITGADVQAVYQTVRWGNFYYRLRVPPGSYRVTLKFAEPLFTQAGKRMFDIVVQGLKVATNWDVAASAGALHALDLNLTNVAVHEGWLTVYFLPHADYPMISGIVISNDGGDATHPAYTRKIRCGGPAVAGYEADPLLPVIPGRDLGRSLDPTSLYVDFASASFGAEVGPQLGSLLASLDGPTFPENPIWILGPGSINPDPRPWAAVQDNYAFVDQFAAFRGQVRGAANLDRFDYWLRFLRLQALEAETGCAKGLLDTDLDALAAASKTNAPAGLAARALADRIALARTWDRLMQAAVAAASNPGEIGTVANLEMRSRGWNWLLNLRDPELAAALGGPLPDSVNPSMTFAGPDRLVVPTARTLAHVGEPYRVRAILLTAAEPPPAPRLDWRPLGGASWASTPMTNAGRNTFVAWIPPVSADFEWRVQAVAADGSTLSWPAAGPPQTVVAWTPPRRPEPPGPVAAYAGAGSVMLSWPPQPGVTGYAVKRSAVAGGPYTTLASGVTATAYADSPPAGQRSFYVVSSLTPDFESVDSEEVVAAATTLAGVTNRANFTVGLSTPIAGAAVLGADSDVWNNLDPAAGSVERASDASGAETALALQVSSISGQPNLVDTAGPVATPAAALLGRSLDSPGRLAVSLSGLPASSSVRLVAYAPGPVRFDGAIQGVLTGGSPSQLKSGGNYLEATQVITDSSGVLQFFAYPLAPTQVAQFSGLQVEWVGSGVSTAPWLSINRTGAGVEISWSAGALWSSAHPTGPFAAVLGAVSPYRPAPTSEPQFFQVR